MLTRICTIVIFLMSAAEALGYDYENWPDLAERSVVLQCQQSVVYFSGPEVAQEYDPENIEDPDLLQALEQTPPLFIERIFTELVKWNGVIRGVNWSNYYLFIYPTNVSIEDVINDLKSVPIVNSCVSNRLVLEGAEGYSDPQYSYQWYLHSDSAGGIGFDLAKNFESLHTVSTPIVGILDSGILLTWPDFVVTGDGTEACVIYPYDPVNVPHGTKVFSVLASIADNSFGMTGIVDDDIYKSYYLDTCHQRLTEWVIATNRAIDECDIITTSQPAQLPDTVFNSAIWNVITTAYQLGKPFIAAAGNDSDDILAYPARCREEVISVGGSGIDGEKWNGSNYGGGLDLVAPAEDIRVLGFENTDVPGEESPFFATAYGTSFAAPIVAGAVAMLMSVDSTLTVDDVRGVLAAGCDDLETAGYDTLTGYGRLNIGESLRKFLDGYELVRRNVVGATSSETSPLRSAYCYGFDAVPQQRCTYIQTKYTFDVQFDLGLTETDTVYCWGQSNGSNGLKDVEAHGYGPDNPYQRVIMNELMSYNIPSSTTFSGTQIVTYAYDFYVNGQPAGHAGPTSEMSATVGYSIFYKRATAARFVNESPHVGLEYDGAPYSATTFDFNEDGQNDLFVSIKQSDASKLFEMDDINGYGVPVFFDRNQDAFAQGELPTAAMGGIATADFDNDGYLDVLVTGGNGGVLRLYHQKPSAPGNFEDWSEEMGLDTFGEDSWAGAWGDYDRDGQIDLYLCRGDANGSDPGSGMGNVTNVLLKNDYADTGEFVDDTQKQGLAGSASTASVTATWMDIDGDGDLDLLRGDAKSVLNGTGSRLYINQGSGPFVDEIADLIPGGAGAVDCISGIKWLDANNDGAIDLVVSRNTDGKSPKVFHNDGDGQFDVATPSTLVLTSAMTGLEAWDYDLDGRQDVLCLPEGSSATPVLFGNRLVDEAIEFHDHTADVGLNTSTGRVDGSVVCDYNRDGDQDLYFGRPVAGDDFYYQARADENSDEPIYNWVGAYLTQRISTNTAPAIGARVTFYGSNGFQQLQVVDGGSGRGSQNDLVLTCGVGEDEGPITCDIVWPSGRVETGRQLTLGTYTTLAEPAGFTLYDSTVTATYQVYPVGLDARMDWTFTWETDYLTDPARDRVLIDTSAQGCGLSDYVLSASDTAVDWNVTPLANGRFRHTMKWTNIPCAQGCTYTYKVKSERDVTAHESNTHSLVIRFCSSGR